MKLAYQVSTPEVEKSPAVTSYQGDLAAAFACLRETGYDGAELMVCDPARVDRRLVGRLAREYGLDIPMICTGEVFGQGRASFSDPDDGVRAEAVRRIRDAVDLAAALGAQINLGRVRGGYVDGQPREVSYRRAFDAFMEISDYAGGKGVIVALEPVNTLVINFINSTRDGLDMVRAVNRDNFRMMLDSAHMFIEDADIGDGIRESRGVCTYVHLSDSNRKYPGNCKIDFRHFIGLLRENGYAGYVSIEVFQVPDQDTALCRSYRHIKPLL